MPLLISDEVLRAADLTESEARVEIACRFFDAGKLSFGHAADAAGLNQLEFADALQKRQIPRFRYSPEDFREDLLAIEKHTGGKNTGETHAGGALRPRACSISRTPLTA